MWICASAAALRPFIFISFVRTPCHGCRSNPQTKYSLSFSVCGPSLAFFRDFGYHGRYSAHGYMCQTTPPLPSFPLFTFSISTTIRNMAAQFASQPRCTAYNPQSTSHIPLSICLTPHPTCHRSGPLESQTVHQIEATTTTITIDQCSVTPTPFSHCPRIPLPNRFMYTSICIYMSVCACL